MVSASEGTHTSLTRTYRGSTNTLQQARQDLIDMLRANELHDVAADAELVLSELASNAVEASPGHDYRVSLGVSDDRLRVAVTNETTADLQGHEIHGPDHALAPQGRGLMIVHALSESVEVTRSGTELTVVAHLVVPA